MDRLRLADANFNRLGEGLRVLEDVARFLLDDAQLTTELRDLRHALKPPETSAGLLAARRAGEDVGAALPQTMQREDVAGMARANARRAQEALRSLEEVSKLPGLALGLDSGDFEKARFALYDIEKRLVLGLGRQDRRQRIAGLYVILDTQFLPLERAEEVAHLVLQSGARVLQLRDKLRAKGELLPLARRLQEICREQGAIFLVNDHPDLALAADADGVHLGQKDLPTAVARRILPLDRLVGRSTATLEEALAAQTEGADYIAVGSIFPTTTKEDIRPAGLETLRRVKAAASVPVIAIGGINESNISQVIQAGADGAAVISAVLGAQDMAAATKTLAQAFHRRGG